METIRNNYLGLFRWLLRKFFPLHLRDLPLESAIDLIGKGDRGIDRIKKKRLLKEDLFE